ncbi:hypothetical protein RJ640_028685 [Escallonia rubra]|uniref:CCDC93 coiled-coil domain-containing protein n=1 Tax=Escallonia rubra TaxID=112253 RepID=A0AA88RFT1_9ASTE|nr:hypothetical protein RJ640_028685 [Escallonia rubra]
MIFTALVGFQSWAQHGSGTTTPLVTIVPQLQLEELKDFQSSTIKLNADLEELNQRKSNVLDKMQHLREKTNTEGANTMVQRLLSLMETLKVLEKQESNFQSYCNAKCSGLQAEVDELEETLFGDNDGENISTNFSHSWHTSIERLNAAKKDIATKLRAIVMLKRQLGDVPSQPELIQYERRFSELYAQIQGKLRQTRKCYATFNALLEIKDMMLKETSLLNSISAQFQDAITSPAGRLKLIDSMEGILKGVQQKAERVQFSQEAEQNVSDALKTKYAAALSEQRRFNSLLKTFQMYQLNLQRCKETTVLIVNDMWFDCESEADST